MLKAAESTAETLATYSVGAFAEMLNGFLGWAGGELFSGRVDPSPAIP